MIIKKIRLKNWKNFRSAEAELKERIYLIGPNASGKSNFLDALRFLRDIAHPKAGGLQRALDERGGLNKIRCLASRQAPQVEIEIELAQSWDADTEWRYVLALHNEGKGANRVLVHKEQAFYQKNKTPKIDRPDALDKKDPARLTQTALEDTRSNAEFREIAEFLQSITYLHLVPQMIQHAEKIGGLKVSFDPFGQSFLERIAATPEKTRTSRLKRISRALKICVPFLDELEFIKDEITGKPHLRARYEHWRPNGGFQREDQFSDGTLRLLGLMWVLLEGGTVLLLEEPELSLDDAIVAKIPALLREMQKSSRSRPQVILTTHSEALLANVDGTEVRRLEASNEGTKIKAADSNEEASLRAGFTPAEVMLPKVHPNSQNLKLF
jgi:energy-coupling factor transporter ATP-binding protein EcfA2